MHFIVPNTHTGKIWVMSATAQPIDPLTIRGLLTYMIDMYITT